MDGKFFGGIKRVKLTRGLAERITAKTVAAATTNRRQQATRNALAVMNNNLLAWECFLFLLLFLETLSKCDIVTFSYDNSPPFCTPSFHFHDLKQLVIIILASGPGRAAIHLLLASKWIANGYLSNGCLLLCCVSGGGGGWWCLSKYSIGFERKRARGSSVWLKSIVCWCWREFSPALWAKLVPH